MAGSRTAGSSSTSSTTRPTLRRPSRTSQKFIGDSKYVAILGSGTRPQRSRPGRSRVRPRCRSSRSRRRRRSSSPPQPYVYLAIPTSRLFAYNLAGYLRARGIKRVWLMGDNGGFGRDGPAQVQKPREQVRARDRRHDDLRADDERLLGGAHEGQELERAGPVAVDGDACREHDRRSSSSSFSCRRSSSSQARTSLSRSSRGRAPTPTALS